MDLIDELGPIDIYLLDQVLRGKVSHDAVVFDAGCGGGRNLHYFLKSGHESYGLDREQTAIAEVRRLASRWGRSADEKNFRVEDRRALPLHASIVRRQLTASTKPVAKCESHGFERG